MRVYKTGETDSSGREVYRKIGDKPKRGRMGLGGKYFVNAGSSSAPEIYAVGRPYKDDYGVFDGEPEYPVEVLIVETENGKSISNKRAV